MYVYGVFFLLVGFLGNENYPNAQSPWASKFTACVSGSCSGLCLVRTILFFLMPVFMGLISYNSKLDSKGD